MRIAIIGMGVVGKAQERWLGEHVHVTYDPKTDDEYPFAEIGSCDFAVVCVPTPMMPNGHADLISVYTALAAMPPGLPVLLRSTVPPGTTDDLNEVTANPIVFCPEFIQENPERAVWTDPQDVPFLFLGGPKDVVTMLAAMLSQVYKGRIYATEAKVAELVKYTANIFLATKVTFANEMSRVCATFGVGWEDVEALWRADPRTGFTHTSVLPGEDGRFGFGGACFTKDLAALIAEAEWGEYDPLFLKAVRDSNRRFRSEQEPTAEAA